MSGPTIRDAWARARADRVIDREEAAEDLISLYWQQGAGLGDGDPYAAAKEACESSAFDLQALRAATDRLCPSTGHMILPVTVPKTGF